MDSYIQISKLNDFIFCPYSLYVHSVYENYGKFDYQSKFQFNGSLNHKNIDGNMYSTSKYIFQGMSVFSDEYNLCGKIDLLNVKNHKLIERKYNITKIYQGYIYQLWGQYVCLIEMKYKIESIEIYSLKNNKSYNIDIPTYDDLRQFKDFLIDIENFDPINSTIKTNRNKCNKCIYSKLCLNSNATNK